MTALLQKIFYRKKRLKRGNSAFSIIVGVFLALFSLSLVIPFLWGFSTSFKDQLDFISNAMGLPKPIRWANYAEAYKNFTVPVPVGGKTVTYNFLGMLLFSLIYAVGGAIVQAVAAALVAYAVARFPRFKISKVLYTVVVVTMILPIVGSMPSEIRIMNALKIWNTVPGILLLKCNFLGTYFLVFHAFFAGLPKDFFEAAEIDGAGHWTIMLRIVFPMFKGMLWTVIVLYFLGNWNDYNVTLVYAPSISVIAYGLYNFNFSNNPDIADVPHKMAGAMILFIPVFIFFCVFQDKFIGSNMSIGGLKE